MSSIVNYTHTHQTGSSSNFNVTIPSTASGNALYVLAVKYSADTIGCTASGATFSLVNSFTGYNSTQYKLYLATGISSGITTVTITNTTTLWISAHVFEINGIASYDTSNGYDNGFDVTNLGTGAITTGATGTGLGIAIFEEYYGNATNCTNGTGWTAGTWDATLTSYDEYRSTAASTGYGGTTGQATGTGTSIRFFGTIINLFDAGGGTTLSINVSDCFDTRTIFG